MTPSDSVLPTRPHPIKISQPLKQHDVRDHLIKCMGLWGVSHSEHKTFLFELLYPTVLLCFCLRLSHDTFQFHFDFLWTYSLFQSRLFSFYIFVNLLLFLLLLLSRFLTLWLEETGYGFSFLKFLTITCTVTQHMIYTGGCCLPENNVHWAVGYKKSLLFLIHFLSG